MNNPRPSTLDTFTMIVPFYRNSAMLERQIQEWNLYPPEVRIVCVDDGSPEPALPIVRAHARPDLDLKLYRIMVDIPWNRGEARNRGAKMAATDWIVQVDIDHVLPAESAIALLNFAPDPRRWYRFVRWRRGRADATRLKDSIPDDQEYGEIHPHVDSYLIRHDLYWQIGGYNEDYSGHIGGGSAFLRRLEQSRNAVLLPRPIRLEVYTRSAIEDASDWSLTRDKSGYQAIHREVMRRGNPKPDNILRSPWREEIWNIPRSEASSTPFAPSPAESRSPDLATAN